MLKKIPVADLRVGMYFARVDGSWLDHGLWRGHFHIADDACLSAVQTSGLRDCWIDTQKGVDADMPAPLARWQSAKRAAVSPARPEHAIDDDLRRAEQICGHAHAAVESIFSDLRSGITPAFDTARPVVEEMVASIFARTGAMTAAAHLKRTADDTAAHSVSVCALMIGLGRELGFDETRCADAGMAGLLHDVGKAFVPPAILNKAGSLTAAEFALMQTHPARGHEVLAKSGVTHRAVLDVCLHHHEREDGSGYPSQLAGDEISVMARMSTVCDVYDALTARRPRKAVVEPSRALAEMAAARGHFDRATLAAFVRTMGIYPVGSLVRLRSGKLAVVMENRPANLRAPLVRAYPSATSDAPLPAHLIDLSLAGANDSVTQAEPGDRWNLSVVAAGTLQRPTARQRSARASELKKRSCASSTSSASQAASLNTATA